jgi:hypothetical protein
MLWSRILARICSGARAFTVSAPPVNHLRLFLCSNICTNAAAATGSIRRQFTKVLPRGSHRFPLDLFGEIETGKHEDNYRDDTKGQKIVVSLRNFASLFPLVCASGRKFVCSFLHNCKKRKINKYKAESRNESETLNARCSMLYHPCSSL